MSYKIFLVAGLCRFPIITNSAEISFDEILLLYYIDFNLITRRNFLPTEKNLNLPEYLISLKQANREIVTSHVYESSYQIRCHYEDCSFGLTDLRPVGKTC